MAFCSPTDARRQKPVSLAEEAITQDFEIPGSAFFSLPGNRSNSCTVHILQCVLHGFKDTLKTILSTHFCDFFESFRFAFKTRGVPGCSVRPVRNQIRFEASGVHCWPSPLTGPDVRLRLRVPAQLRSGRSRYFRQTPERRHTY